MICVKVPDIIGLHGYTGVGYNISINVGVRVCNRKLQNVISKTANIGISVYNPGPALRSLLQNDVWGVSHFQLVSGSLDMNNHRGACSPS